MAGPWALGPHGGPHGALMALWHGEILSLLCQSLSGAGRTCFSARSFGNTCGSGKTSVASAGGGLIPVADLGRWLSECDHWLSAGFHCLRGGAADAGRARRGGRGTSAVGGGDGLNAMGIMR